MFSRRTEFLVCTGQGETSGSASAQWAIRERCRTVREAAKEWGCPNRQRLGDGRWTSLRKGDAFEPRAATGSQSRLKRRELRIRRMSGLHLLRYHLKIMRGVPDTTRITRDGANEPAIPRQRRKAGPALLHCERIVCEPISRAIAACSRARSPRGADARDCCRNRKGESSHSDSAR